MRRMSWHFPADRRLVCRPSLTPMPPGRQGVRQFRTVGVDLCPCNGRSLRHLKRQAAPAVPHVTRRGCRAFARATGASPWLWTVQPNTATSVPNRAGAVILIRRPSERVGALTKVDTYQVKAAITYGSAVFGTALAALVYVGWLRQRARNAAVEDRTRILIDLFKDVAVPNVILLRTNGTDPHDVSVSLVPLSQVEADVSPVADYEHDAAPKQDVS